MDKTEEELLVTPAPKDHEQRATEIAEWLRYQPYVPASVRETLLSEIARLRLGMRADEGAP